MITYDITIIVNTFLISVCLPLGIIWLTGKNLRKSKELEKTLEHDFKTKDEGRLQEKIVYASLSKILFDVQQLHVTLSGPCIDSNCLTKALEKFDQSITKYHEEITGSMLYLSSKNIDRIYEFYRLIGELKLELLVINEKKDFELANVCVYHTSRNLADKIIELHQAFIETTIVFKNKFNSQEFNNMKNCCAKPASAEVQKKYTDFKKTYEKEREVNYKIKKP